jgi:hypothetical protein
MIKKSAIFLAVTLPFSAPLAAEEGFRPLGLSNPLEAANYCRDAALVVTHVAASLAKEQSYVLISNQQIFSLSLRLMEVKQTSVNINERARTASIGTATSVVASLMHEGRDPNEASDRYYLVARSAAECMTTIAN